MQMNRILIILITLSLILVTYPVHAISSEWSCNYGDSPFGDIKITYANKDASNTAQIFAINPQKHPIIYPNGKLVLQLNSESCFEYTMKIKDSSGVEISKHSAKPYSPYPECDIQSGVSTQGTTFLTTIDFNAPNNPGKYTLDIYDNRELLLTTGSMNILDPSTTISSVSRTSWCTVEDSNYTVVLETPYPVIYEENNPGKINIFIRGSNTSIMSKMFDQISMSISPQYQAQISLAKEGSPVCSANECKQVYTLSSSASTSAIAYVWHEEGANSKSSINSKGITLLEVGKIKDIQMKLMRLSTNASEYVEHYNALGDSEKVKAWQEISTKLKILSDKMNNIAPLLESRNFKISDVVNLITMIENSQKEIDEIIDVLEVSGGDVS